MRILFLIAIALTLTLTGCDDIREVMLSESQADEPIETTTHNLRIRFETETNQVIVAWVSYEEDGHRTVSRRIEIPK